MIKKLSALLLALTILFPFLPIGPSTLTLAAADEGWLWPVPSRWDVGSRFGYRTINGTLQHHNGIDVGGNNRTVVAARSGTVVRSQHCDSRSNCGCRGGQAGSNVLIRHETADGVFYSHYLHLQPGGRIPLMDAIGNNTWVNQGDVIGTTGYTGFTVPSGPGGAHLHFEVRRGPRWGDAVIDTNPGTGIRYQYTDTVPLRYTPTAFVPVQNEAYAIGTEEAPVHFNHYHGSRELTRLALYTPVTVTGHMSNSRGEHWYSVTDVPGVVGGAWINGSHVITEAEAEERQRREAVQHAVQESVDRMNDLIDRIATPSITITPLSPSQIRFSNRANAPLRSTPYDEGESNIMRRLAEGEVAIVDGTTVNSRNNRWYRLEGGGWIYSGNLFSVRDLTIVRGNRFAARADAPVRARPYQEGTTVRRLTEGEMVTLHQRARNSHNNTWYRLTDGNWIYSGNLFAMRGFTTLNTTRFAVNTNPIRRRPFNDGTEVRRLVRGESLTIVGRGLNDRDNIWYRLSDGTWVFSGNVSASRP